MKTVLKWNPYLDFELSAQEAWLEELSQEGLTIRFRLSSLTVCSRGEPRPGRRFRIEPARTWASASDPPARELTELYEAAGWHYLSRLPGERGELFYTDEGHQHNYGVFVCITFGGGDTLSAKYDGYQFVPRAD